jgi:hypothetical protein
MMMDLHDRTKKRLTWASLMTLVLAISLPLGDYLSYLLGVGLSGIIDQSIGPTLAARGGWPLGIPLDGMVLIVLKYLPFSILFAVSEFAFLTPRDRYHRAVPFATVVSFLAAHALGWVLIVYQGGRFTSRLYQFFSRYSLDTDPNAIQGWIFATVVGVVIGICQWLLRRATWKRAWFWALGSSIGIAGIYVLETYIRDVAIFSNASYLSIAFRGAIMGIGFGAVTALFIRDQQGSTISRDRLDTDSPKELDQPTEGL